MPMRLLLRTFLLSVCSCWIFQSLSAQTYIVHANLVNVESRAIQSDYTVVIRDGIITEVGPSSRIRPRAGAQIVDATGKWLLPGLVDAHVHFFQTGGLYTRPDAIDLRKYHPYEKEIDWYKKNMEAQLRRYLAHGITTVIDEGATLALLQQRDSFATKSYAPRILMAGPLVSTNYSPKPFDVLSDPDQPFYTVHTPEEAVHAAQKEYPYHPDFIKIWYIVTSGDVRKGAYDALPMVKATIEDAHRNHYKVAVHATEAITARLAVEAGADYLVHEVQDSVVDDSFIRLLKERNVVVCPTLVVYDGYLATFGQNYVPTPEDLAFGDPDQLKSLQDLQHLPDSTIGKRYSMTAAFIKNKIRHGDTITYINLKKMADAGVIIASGTDAGNPGTLHASSFFKELRAMQGAGLSNWQILVSSTLNGARVLGKEKEFGSISKGKAADLLILDGNPVEDLANLEKIDKICHRGEVWNPGSL